MIPIPMNDTLLKTVAAAVLGWLTWLSVIVIDLKVAIAVQQARHEQHAAATVRPPLKAPVPPPQLAASGIERVIRALLPAFLQEKKP
jgi:hypothetical protein